MRWYSVSGGQGKRRPIAEQDIKEFEPLHMHRPITTRHRVSGVERIRPTGPHNHDQKMAATTTEKGERPVLLP